MTHNDFKSTITQALEEMKAEQGDCFDISAVNLAELERRTGISRARLRRLKKNSFEFRPHANTGHRSNKTVLAGFEECINDLLAHGVSNSNVCFDRIKALGYQDQLPCISNLQQYNGAELRGVKVV